jgi:multisubunit Na+/H+ antiporter MnhB subunit
MNALDGITDDTRLTPLRLMIMLFVLTLAGALGWAVCSLPENSSGLAVTALAELPNSGVLNPVTAAVLNYRGYDTLLEIAVLLLAVIGVWSLAEAERPAAFEPASPVLLSFLRIVLPLMILIAGYLLWIGSFAPGGAFQGGAVLAGVLVLLRLSNQDLAIWSHEILLRLCLVLGLSVFIAVAVGVMAGGGKLLEYPRAHAGMLILLIESAALISIALTLAALFVGGRALSDEDSSRASENGVQPK